MTFHRMAGEAMKRTFMPENLLPGIGPVARLESSVAGSDGSLAAFRSHLTRWEQKRLYPRSDYHRDLAETKVNHYTRVIEALLSGRAPPATPRLKARPRTWHIYRHFDEDE